MGYIRITNNTDENLTDDNTDDFKVSDRIDPLLVADLVGLPAARPDRSEKWRQVTNREKDISCAKISYQEYFSLAGEHTPRDPILRQAKPHFGNTIRQDSMGPPSS
jgi:hypothetical protein